MCCVIWGGADGGPTFDKADASFLMDTPQRYATVALNTDGQDMPAVTYSIWVKLNQAVSNKGWVMTQSPDQAWSRAITLNDDRLSKLSGVSQTSGGSHQNTLPKPPIGTWFLVTATWQQDGSACTYLDTTKGLCTTARNGKGTQQETLFIGGYGPNSADHNPNAVVSDVKVYSTVLSHANVTKLYNYGRSGVTPGASRVCTASTNVNAAHSVGGSSGAAWMATASATACKHACANSARGIHCPYL